MKPRFGHGAGVLDAFAQESVGIINLDAHLDLRQTDRATSGTPFRQLAQLCDVQSRAFHYACFRREPCGEYAGVVAGSAVAECYPWWRIWTAMTRWRR
ncbi:formimidoylglutamase [Salmonella enterica subsp. enterica]|uniref:Formimidoylglutamase n=1 Tax=Salmonella enterica I TaxID=59201 RepID=A0A447MVQ7_SALET|nr:formimidoylglutamase [Salmonella enterica subsp. enterica]